MKQHLLVFLLVLLFTFVLTTAAKIDINENIVNKEVSREIDLSNHITKHKITIDLENKDTKPIDNFLLSFKESQVQGSLGYIRVTQNKGALNHQGPFFDQNYENIEFYRVSLRNKLPPGESIKINIRLVYVRSQTPFPKEITQKDNQYMVYRDNHYFFTPYQTLQQTTQVTFPSENIEGYSNLDPTDKSNNKVTYGPYTSSVSKFSESPMRVHFQSNSPVLTFINAERFIEISNWGNLAIEEHYLLEHSGATLKGGFSRLEFQRSPLGSAPSSYRTLTAMLPRVASDIYYRDEIGNISTSTVRPSRKNMEVDFRTRYPMFGGWKSRFYIGYNLPLSRYLKVDVQDSSYHILNTTFSIPFKNAIVDSMTVNIILPEGASNEHVHIPFEVEEDRSVTVTYLDTAGRPTIVLHKNNIVPEHNKRFQVTYEFSKILMLREPLLLMTGFMVILSIIIIFTHLQCSLSPDDTESISNLIEEFVELKLTRDGKYGEIEQQIQDLLKNNPAEFHKAFDKIKEDLTQLSNRAESLIKAMPTSSKKKIGIMREAEQKEKERLDAISRLATALEQHHKKKNKQNEVQKAEKQYDKLSEEIEDLCASLNEF